MVKKFAPLLLCVVLLATACSAPLSLESPTRTPLVIPTDIPAGSSRLETQVGGVDLGIDVPTGWEGRSTNDGLVLAEHFDPMDATNMADGIQVHIFVHSADAFSLPENTRINAAWNVLRQVSENPSYVGEAAITDPQAFEWDGHDAAFYLLNDGDGSVTMLMALMLRDPLALVVSNISAPESRHDTIRPLLPELYRSLTVNGQRMSLSVLDTLPDPLTFPTYVSHAAPASPK